MTYVALSRARTLSGVLIHPFPFDRISKLSLNKAMQTRIQFQKALEKLAENTKQGNFLISIYFYFNRHFIIYGYETFVVNNF